MKKILIITAAACLACASVFAQNLNPEVQVTNDYQARMADVHKKGTVMQVPDSLTKFSTAIDYSVFRTDYKGAYDFSPYSIALAPEARPYDGARFYLRTGAGYSFHPVLRAVYTPFPKGLVRGGAYLSLDGYAGKYSSMDDGRGLWSGRDLSGKGGAMLRWNKESFDLSGDLSWNGIFTADDAMVSNYNKAALDMNIHSNTEDAKMIYDIDAGFHYSADGVSALGRLSEFGYVFDGYLVPEISSGLRLRVDVRSQGSWISGVPGISPVLLNTAAPKAVFDWGTLKLAAGVRLASSKKITIHPDIRAQWVPQSRKVGVSLGIGGGQSVGDYAHYKSQDHWFNVSYLDGFEPTVEKISATLAVRGLLLSRLHYDLSGGYRILNDSPVQGLSVDSFGLYTPGIVFADYSQAWGKLLLNWTGERFNMNLDALYSYTDLEQGPTWLSLPSFSVDADASYNWNRRIYAGVRCKVLGARESTLVSLPALVDLGLYGEYFFGRSFSAWAQIGNLLDQRLSYSPTHIAGGINFTAGICLKLQ